MKMEEHVLKAIDAFNRNEKNHALMHASFAIEATARNIFLESTSGKNAYKNCLRQYWWIIERFIGEGLNLEESKFTHLKLDNGYGKLIENPDFVDIVYHIFRCNNAHAKEIPIEYELLPARPGHYIWIIDRLNNGIQMPETVVWALLAVSVFCKANHKIQTEGEYFLSWGGVSHDITKFVIKDWWGEEDRLKQFFSDKSCIRVKLEV